MNITNTNRLSDYLKDKGRLLPDEQVTFHILEGGISCRTVLVQRENGADFVLKQARSQLRVEEEWFSDPARIHIEAKAMRTLGELVPGRVPKLLFEDAAHYLLGMEAVPQPHDNWKSLLLQGQIDFDHFEQFAVLLAGIHRESYRRDRFSKSFADRRFFETLRLEPYYVFTARQVPEAASFLQQLIKECRRIALTLVHGDYSPKNILIRQKRLILLDHEVMHYGDGAFDLGFSLTHFISKARHVTGHRRQFLDAASYYWNIYRDRFPVETEWEQRAVRHTIACMLARVRGKSPLEYLSATERLQQETLCLKLAKVTPDSVEELISEVSDSFRNLKS